jgi:fructose-bisphosphate aldolase class II
VHFSGLSGLEFIMSKATHYTELGLANTKIMFKKAMEGGYAIPAYNFNNMEQLQGFIIGCAESKSPVILQVSGSARKYADPIFLPYMAMGAVQMVKALGANIPIALHLDHGDSFELAKSCIDSGFSSVMLDGSHHPFDENAALTRQVVDYAHERDVTVEGELGVLAGVEDEVSHEVSHFTKPEEVEAFVEKTGVDSLAISIGTSHGAFKFKVKPGEEVTPLRYDIL